MKEAQSIVIVIVMPVAYAVSAKLLPDTRLTDGFSGSPKEIAFLPLLCIQPTATLIHATLIFLPKKSQKLNFGFWFNPEIPRFI